MTSKEIFDKIVFKFKEKSTSGKLLRLGWFLAVYYLGKYFLNGLEQTIFYPMIVSILLDPLLFSIDSLSTGFWGLFYNNLFSSSDYITCINNSEVLQLLPGCSGLKPLLRVTFILLIYPLPLKKKIYTFFISWLIIFFAATLHFIILVPIAFHWPEFYGFSHDKLSKILFYAFFFLNWIIWERIGYPKEKKEPA